MDRLNIGSFNVQVPLAAGSIPPPAELETGSGALSWNFRFGPLACASYASTALDTTNLPPGQPPARPAGFPTARFVCLSDEPGLLLRNRFLRHCSDPPLSASRSFDQVHAMDAGVLTDAHRHIPRSPLLGNWPTHERQTGRLTFRFFFA